MPEIIEIRDPKDKALAVFSGLTDAQLRAGFEREEGIFLAEGCVAALNAIACGCKPVSLLIERRHINGKAKELIEKSAPAPVYTADEALLSGITGYAFSRGVLCAFARPQPQSPDAVLSRAKRIAVLEDIVDQTNVGALMRSAAALGMDAVVLSPSCCDPLGRRALRVSMGSVLRVPWCRVGKDAADWRENGAKLLHGYGFTLAALALREDTLSISDPKLKEIDRLALVLGTEGDGLRETTIAACDLTVKIPMYGGVDSLNVAAAGAIAFYESGKH